MALLISLLMMLLAILLLYFNRRVQPSSVWFSASIFLISLLHLTHYFVFSGKSVWWAAVLFNHTSPFFYLLGPSLFFYVRSTLSDQHRLSLKDRWHFIPFFIQLIAIMPYIFKPWSYKLWVAGEVIRDVHNMLRIPDLVLLPVQLNMAMRPITWMLYSCYSLYLVLSFRRTYKMSERVPPNDAKRTLQFLVSFLVICLATTLSYVGLSIEYFLKFDQTTAVFITTPWTALSAVGVAILPFMLLLYPEIIYGIPRWKKDPADIPIHSVMSAQSMPGDSIATNVTPASSTEQKEDSPEDASVHFIELADRIPKVMAEQQLYLDPDFNLEDLSKALDVPKHHLYYCFNCILKTRFTQLRAQCRVQYAQQLIGQGETRDKTFEAIGLMSGFSSRSSFLNTFRDITGMTPRDFQRTVEALEPGQDSGNF